MNRMDHLERDLTSWLDDIAVPRTPDYADEILQQTARVHQRPRWTFVGRWLPERATRLAPLLAITPCRKITRSDVTTKFVVAHLR